MSKRRIDRCPRKRLQREEQDQEIPVKWEEAKSTFEDIVNDGTVSNKNGDRDQQWLLKGEGKIAKSERRDVKPRSTRGALSEPTEQDKAPDKGYKKGHVYGSSGKCT